MNARPSAIFCHSPPDSSTPPSNHLPSGVSQPSGSRSRRLSAPPLRGRVLDRVAVLDAGRARRDRCSRPPSPGRSRSPGTSRRSGAATAAGSSSRRSTPSRRIRPVGRVVQPADELDQRRLPRAVPADDRDGLAGHDPEADVGEAPRGPARVAERDVLEDDLAATSSRPDAAADAGARSAVAAADARSRPASPAARTGRSGRGGSRTSSRTRQEALDRRLDRRRGLGVEGQVAEGQLAGDRLERDVQVGQRAGQDRDRAPDEARRSSGSRRVRAGGPGRPGRQLPESIDEVRPEAEELDLLGVRVGRHERRQVVHAPADRRGPAGEAVAAPAVARVGDERGDRRDRARRRRGSG